MAGERPLPADPLTIASGFAELSQFAQARGSYQEFCIPICILPATISNNVPSTDLSLGGDTALDSQVEVRAPLGLLPGWPSPREHCHRDGLKWKLRGNLAAIQNERCPS